MGDLAKLKIAIAQTELVEGRPSANERSLQRALEIALDEGADVLVAPNSLVDGANVRLIGLNDSRIDIADNVVFLDARGESYRVSIGKSRPDCDFSVVADTSAFTVLESEAGTPSNTVVLRPVGMLDAGKSVRAYDGGSAAYGAGGTCLARLRDDFEEDVRTFALAQGCEHAGPCERKLLTALVRTLRRFDEQVLGGQAKWVIGLSGGLDSSVVAGLLVLAFGSERTVGYNMATRFNSEATKGNAASLASRLGIPIRNGSIEDMVVSMGNALVGFGYRPDALSGLVLENAQARTRGNLLATFSALEGGVVVNNGNRVESALGYATLYGDSIGAFAPIADLTKVQLFGLARDINAVLGCEAVPENLLPTVTDEGYDWETMPSAELSSGQRDPMKWFYHDWLVGELLGDSSDEPVTIDEAACTVVERYACDKLESSEVAKWVRFYGLDDPRAFVEDLEWVLRLMHGSAFKRVQAPPFIALASAARGTATICGPQTPPEQSRRLAELLASVRGR